ncbi:hemagglutinin repeat-containing protein [Pasteurella testudinis]|uniref:hemagglutinin repeat-containing protein n=1 Tax=Pasteurella testudinis TaxID=761 RepID=UPI003AB91D84
MLTADRADNRGGVWNQRSEQALSLNFDGGLNNQAGQIGSVGDIILNTSRLDNRQGVLSGSGNLSINTRQGELNNRDGRIGANRQLQLDSGVLDNQGGLIQSGASAVINTHGQQLDNRNTLNNERNQGIVSLATLEIWSGSFDNRQGYLAAQGSQQLNLLGDLDNRQGEIIALGDVTLQAKNWENSHGKLGSNGALTVNLSADLRGENSRITAQQDLTLSAKTVRQSNQSLLHSNRTLQLNAQSLSSTENSEISGQQLAIRIDGEVDNEQSRLLAEQALNIASLALNNTQGVIASLQGDMTLNTQRQQLNNQRGQVQAKKTISLQTGLLHNQQGLIQSGSDMRIETDNQRLNNSNTLTNEATGGIISLGKLTIRSADLGNQAGFIASVDEQTLQANQLNNTEGVIRSDGSQRTQLSGGFINTAGRLQAGQNLQLHSLGLDNTAGLIRSRQNVRLDTQNQALINDDTLNTAGSKGIIAFGGLAIESTVLSNQRGYIASQNAQRINAGELANQQGVIQTNDNLQLNVNGQVNNAVGRMLSERALTVQSGELNNRSGLLQGKQQLTIDTQSRNLDNSQTLNSELSQGLVTLGELSLNTAKLLNQQGAIISAQQQIRATDLQNEQGLVQANAAQKLTVSGELDNRQGQIRAAKSDIHAQTLDNNAGRVSANQQLTIKVNDALLNVTGQLVSGEENHIQADKLNNRQGTIGSQNAGVTLTVHGELNNQQGHVMANRDAVLTSQQLDNRQGSINSLANIQIDTRQQTLSNQQGKIVAGQSVALLSGELFNQNGLISGQRAVSIDTQGQALDNRDSKGRGIVSSGDVSLRNLSNLDNRQGDLTAGKALQLHAQQIDNRDDGLLLGVDNLHIDSNTLDNRSGVIQTIRHAVIVATATINNSKNSDNGSLIQSGGELQMTTSALDNSQTKAPTSEPTQGLVANTLRLKSDSVNNQSGGIYTTAELDGQIRQTLDNRQGEILSLGRLALQGAELALNNQDGKLESGRQLKLDLDRFLDEGSIKTQGDADISLKQDLTLTKAFQVDGSLNLSTQGNFYNRTQLITGNGLSVQAQHIDNPFGSELSSQNTQINASSLTNRGLIDGTRNVIKTGQLENLGTGRIYGDHLAIQADNLRNDQETVNGETKSATIAARERLDLGVGTLTNHDHALIFSLGDLAIGGQLDADNHATGRANFIDNGSATIEALGNGAINTARLWNHDLHLSTGIDETNEQIEEVALAKSSHRYRRYVEGEFNWSGENAWFRFYDGSQPTIYQKEWYGWRYNRKTETTRLDHQDPGKILFGGNLSLQGNELHNQFSKLLIGGVLTLDEQVFTKNEENVSLSSGNTFLNNEDLKKFINITDKGQSLFWQHYKNWRGKHGHRDVHHKDYMFSHDTQELRFNITDNSIGNLQVVTANSSNQQITSAPENEKATLTGVNVGLSLSTVQAANANNETVVAALNTFNANAVKELNGAETSVISVQNRTPDIVGVSPNQMGSTSTLTIKTYSPILMLPQASLYKINPATNSHVLVETDPQFANRRQWLSSDYMFDALRSDHNSMHKRLGDGFYEQRLINEQINQLTGRRFLDNYQSDYEQYKALMDNGVKYAAQFGLIPGVALSEAQMKELTTDMVWLVNREVRLADGSVTTVLAPQVYIVARDSDVTARGAVISANRIIANTSGDIENSGVIAGRQLTALSGENIRNLGGTLQSEQLLLEAQQELTNLGGSWLADKKLSAQAKSIRIESTLSETEDTGEFYKKGLNQLAKVRLNNRDGELIFRSQDDITIKGATFDIAGKTMINAGNQLNLGTLTTENKEQYNFNNDNYYRLHQTAEVGNQLNFNGDTILTGENEVVIRGNQIHGDGKLLVTSKGNIRVEEARQTEQLSSASKTSSKGLLSKTTEIRKHDHDYDLAVGSQIDAKEILVQSQQGDVRIIGSDVVAEETMLIQGKNVSIVEAENRMKEENFSRTTKKGIMSSGGFGFTIGSRQTTLETDNRKYYSRGSQVGSLNGDMLVVAEKDYLQRGSAVTSLAGDTQVQAKRIDITAADDRYETDQKYTFEQKGLTVAVNVPALQAVQSAVETVKNIGSSKNDRINAMGAANAAWDSYKAGKDLKALGEGLANGDMSAQNVSVSITYGEQKNINQTHTEGNTANSSKLHAGGKALLMTTGEKDTSHINIKGSDVAGLKGTALQTAGKIAITAAEQNHQERSKNSSQGWNAGVAVSYGSDGFAFGVTAGGNLGRGYGNGDERTWINSHVGLQESNTTIISGGDTHIVGGVVRGKGIHTDIGGDLTIASVQDSLQYTGKQQNIGGQITVGYGVSGSASYNQSKMNADYASVQEQSGLFAGDDGYQVTVKGHTELSGGLLTSTAQAESEGKNRFRTGTIDYRDIENHANYSGSTLGVSGGFSVGGGESAQEIGGMTLASQGQNYAQKEGDPNSGKGKTEVSMGIGFGSDSSSASGVTRSGINTRNIEIIDSVAQQARTGKSAETVLSGLQTDITTESALARSGRVSNQFDKDALQKELDIQRATTEGFGKTAAQGVAYTAEKLGDVNAYELTEGVKAQAEQALKHETDPSKRATLEDKIAQADAYLEQNQANYALWKEGGAGRTALHALAGGMLTGNVSGAVASGTTSAAAPHLNALGQELGDVGKAVLDIGAGMAIGAATGGGTAALSAGGNTDWYNRQLHPSELDWIRNNAETFAKEQGISVAEAEQRLIERAAQRVDYAWSKMIDSQDAAADSFLSSASGMKGDVPSSSAVSFINSDGKSQNLFSASGDEYYSIGKYSGLAAGYDKANQHVLTEALIPNIKNNLIFESIKDGASAVTDVARTVLDSPIETTKNVVKTVEHTLSDCLKNPTACATGKWATFDTSSGDLLRTHYNQTDVNALYGKDMRAETALVPLVRGGTVVAEVLPVVKAGSVAVKSVDNMLSPLAKGVDANEKLPVVGKTADYDNQISIIKSGETFNEIINKVPGRIIDKYDITNIGSLDNSIAETFSGGRYATIIIDKDLRAYRAWSPGQSREFGAFWTLDKPLGSLQTRIDSALKPEWGNVRGTNFYSQADRYTEIIIPKGVVIHIGEVGSQGGAWVGGKSQFLINNGASPSWKIKEEKLK